MKFEHTSVMNFDNAFRGMRNPKESWNKSDSVFGLVNLDETSIDYDVAFEWLKYRHPDIKDEDEYQLDNKLDDELEDIDKWIIKQGLLKTNDPDYPTIADVAFIGPKDTDLARRLIKAGSEHRKFLRQIFVSVDITAPLYW